VRTSALQELYDARVWLKSAIGQLSDFCEESGVLQYIARCGRESATIGIYLEDELNVVAPERGAATDIPDDADSLCTHGKKPSRRSMHAPKHPYKTPSRHDSRLFSRVIRHHLMSTDKLERSSAIRRSLASRRLETPDCDVEKNAGGLGSMSEWDAEDSHRAFTATLALRSLRGALRGGMDGGNADEDRERARKRMREEVPELEWEPEDLDMEPLPEFIVPEYPPVGINLAEECDLIRAKLDETLAHWQILPSPLIKKGPMGAIDVLMVTVTKFGVIQNCKGCAQIASAFESDRPYSVRSQSAIDGALMRTFARRPPRVPWACLGVEERPPCCTSRWSFIWRQASRASVWRVCLP
jgi:hypothetical protein